MINLMGGVPTLGAIVGSFGSDDLLASINSGLGGTHFFGSVDDVLAAGRKAFVSNIVDPIRNIGRTIKKQIEGVLVGDKYIAITDVSQLNNIPTCMHEPILAFAPVRELFEQGRIFGFGYKCAPEEDAYGRLIDNGHIEDVAEAMDEHGAIEFKYEWRSTDPDLDFDELDNISTTRNFIREMIRKGIDVTDYPNNIN